MAHTRYATHSKPPHLVAGIPPRPGGSARPIPRTAYRQTPPVLAEKDLLHLDGHDEIFHIPQTQRYCDEDFDYWDPAITTPPGLYLLSAIPLMTVHIPCSPTILRSTNLLFSTAIIPGILSVILEPSFAKPLWRHLMKPSSDALVISSFPLIFFFANLYYTDVASLAGVLAAYALALRGWHWSSSLVGAWSITVRQTNVVWLGFTVAVTVLREVKNERKGKLEDETERAVDQNDPLLSDVIGFSQLVTATMSSVDTILSRPRKFVKVILPYIPTFLSFLIFLKWNDGIVLGHKELHQPVIHLPQMFYFVAFASVMLLPILFSDGMGIIRGALRIGLGSWPRVMASAVILAMFDLAVHYSTIYHPFLLADNRHYVFYFLHRIFLPFPAAKYLLTPVYLFGCWAWIWRLRRSATILWMIGFLAATALVLVPSPLIEPRYFLIPTVFLRLQVGPTPFVWLEYGWYALINVSTVALFLLRKFRWEGWEGWMRFMW
ncbi:MAG: glucosyltransferase [Tremellales sp. Tagirdzhanova-0007]|nr:MAG: glucosyltransferase [Tremellales sp. Tagirdzhanova-0007]